MEIAEEFSTYVSQSFRHILVYGTEMPSGEWAACLRVWQGDEDEGEEAEIKATLAITNETAWCTDRERGIREIDLRDPQAFEKILKWMKDIGLVRFDVRLTGKLA